MRLVAILLIAVIGPCTVTRSVPNYCLTLAICAIFCSRPKKPSLILPVSILGPIQDSLSSVVLQPSIGTTPSCPFQILTPSRPWCSWHSLPPDFHSQTTHGKKACCQKLKNYFNCLPHQRNRNCWRLVHHCQRTSARSIPHGCLCRRLSVITNEGCRHSLELLQNREQRDWVSRECRADFAPLESGVDGRHHNQPDRQRQRRFGANNRRTQLHDIGCGRISTKRVLPVDWGKNVQVQNSVTDLKRQQFSACNFVILYQTEDSRWRYAFQLALRFVSTQSKTHSILFPSSQNVNANRSVKQISSLNFTEFEKMKAIIQSTNTTKNADLGAG